LIIISKTQFAAVASGEESLEDVEADARDFALALASVYAGNKLLWLSPSNE